MPRMLMICCLAVALLVGPAPVLAGPELPDEEQPASKPVVATIYINNAKTTYDSEITAKLTERFNAKLAMYDIRKGDRYVEKLDKIGVTDISVAERADILKAFEGEGVDYVVYAEVQPPVLNEWIAFFNAGYKVAIVVPMKILDVKAGKYLYTGKFTEHADNSAVIGGVGTKGAVMAALELILAKTDEALTNRLPMKK
ncbi:MAG: hypothetical protein RIN56_06310 [Sporomusaceae bacterium]|nr:hypothetical protein [Sporomusaceae bacterium]